MLDPSKVPQSVRRDEYNNSRESSRTLEGQRSRGEKDWRPASSEEKASRRLSDERGRMRDLRASDGGK